MNPLSDFTFWIVVVATPLLWALMHEGCHALAVMILDKPHVVRFTPTWTIYRKLNGSYGIQSPFTHWDWYRRDPPSKWAQLFVHMSPRILDVAAITGLLFVNDPAQIFFLGVGGLIDYVWGIFRPDTLSAARSIGLPPPVLQVILLSLLAGLVYLVGRAVLPF